MLPHAVGACSHISLEIQCRQHCRTPHLGPHVSTLMILRVCMYVPTQSSCIFDLPVTSYWRACCPPISLTHSRRSQRDSTPEPRQYGSHANLFTSVSATAKRA